MVENNIIYKIENNEIFITLLVHKSFFAFFKFTFETKLLLGKSKIILILTMQLDSKYKLNICRFLMVARLIIKIKKIMNPNAVNLSFVTLRLNHIWGIIILKVFE